jgi:hypothetical protein
MSGGVPPLPKYAFMAWCSVKSTGTTSHIPNILLLRVLRSIFGPKGEEVTGAWRKLHNEELHNLYASQNIIRVIK